MRPRTRYTIAASIAIPMGIVSRAFPLGWVVYDKYLGDALYAIMVYLVLGWLRPGWKPAQLAGPAMAINLSIECLQLTGIGLELSRSGNPLSRLVSIVLGTTFGWRDLLAYAVGISLIFGWDLYGRDGAAAER